MGPKLFNIFLSDFPIVHSSNSEVKSILYADDTIIYAMASSPSTATKLIQDKIQLLTTYYSKWGIKLNESTCSTICFRNAYDRARRGVVKESKTITINLSGHNVPLKNSIKYLGIHLHHRFRFNPHIDQILKKATGVVSVLKPLLNSKSLRKDTKLLLYKTLIRPVICYGFISWFTVSPNMALRMEIFERKILRHCINSYRKPDKTYYSNKHIYDKSEIVPIMTYLMNLANRSLERIKNHENSLVKNVYIKNEMYSLFDNYYLSPINLVHNRSKELITQPDENTFMLPFYEKNGTNAYRG